MTESDPPARFLEWDSEFFGMRIGKAEANELSSNYVRGLNAWCRAERIDCLYFLARSDHEPTTRLARESDFDLVDFRVGLSRHLDRSPAANRGEYTNPIRAATANDIPTLEKITEKSFGATRFYFDPHFPEAQCDALYRLWIAKSCGGYADKVFVATAAQDPVGYISCLLNDDRVTGQIGLVGISESARGKGVGQDLVCTALDWFALKGIKTVNVVTQGRNVAAQRLYQKCGFMTASTNIWYHKWYL